MFSARTFLLDRYRARRDRIPAAFQLTGNGLLPHRDGVAMPPSVGVSSLDFTPANVPAGVLFVRGGRDAA